MREAKNNKKKSQEHKLNLNDCKHADDEGTSSRECNRLIVK